MVLPAPDDLDGIRVLVTIMGPPIVWLASDRATGVHDRRIVATEFDAASAGS